MLSIGNYTNVIWYVIDISKMTFVVKIWVDKNPVASARRLCVKLKTLALGQHIHLSDKGLILENSV